MMCVRLIFIFALLSLVSCSKESPVQTTYIKPKCIQTQSSCQIKTRFGDVEVKFNVEKVKVETAFSIYVHLNTKELLAESKNFIVKGFMEGKNMYMGKIPLLFTGDVSEEKQENMLKLRFKADVLVGSCNEQQMEWRIWLTINDNNGNQITHFVDFSSFRS